MKKIVLVLLLHLVYCTSFSQLRTSFLKDSFDNYVNEALKKWQVPGAAICVIQQGKIVVMKTYGVREMNKPERVDENTLFMIGSNTKAFTSTALATLQEEKKLQLDDHVQQWLPDFRLRRVHLVRFL
ncbi:beta-lactamase family protein [Chitinophaga pendula]|uniref:serine hydrolase domain-containing protein n=1 Tax=Chitinophaga TaxID=79328 RepID=UPI0012FD73F4|nr:MULTISPECIES: serine hydrolase domain-containing protein [Chitinophaga]UCJ10062.1 beta-lactamase family protein [Chitinophaga pendula]